jgi:phosphoglycolate phosphatase
MVRDGPSGVGGGRHVRTCAVVGKKPNGRVKGTDTRRTEAPNLAPPLARDVTEHDAVVYDLDGTLVRLAVDWGVVRDDVAAALAEAGIETDGETLWELLERGVETGHRDLVEATIADHEREGARTAERLPTADELAGTDRPAAVCSLNCEAACRIALERHGLDGHVGAVVGRDSVATEKPNPEPLLATLRALDADPSRALFVGDTDRDAETAERASVAFRYVDRRAER